MATTYIVQQDGMAGLGLASHVIVVGSAIVPQLKLTVDVTRQVRIEPNNVGVSSGGGETSVVF
jgi:hypothetical protein